MIEVQYFYTGTEALLMKIVFTENRLFEDNFLEKVGGANAPPAPPALPTMEEHVKSHHHSTIKSVEKMPWNPFGNYH